MRLYEDLFEVCNHKVLSLNFFVSRLKKRTIKTWVFMEKPLCKLRYCVPPPRERWETANIKTEDILGEIRDGVSVG